MERVGPNHYKFSVAGTGSAKKLREQLKKEADREWKEKQEKKQQAGSSKDANGTSQDESERNFILEQAASVRINEERRLIKQ
ncbi:uncharacterized protein J7T54_007189 [Emericellopsis cladophorae]|uniref:Uncharacterized protein n=1 Tax=Emericellopsis cladophorae TaxID=2686198 RepID=A0A9P9XV28_9HYPO|nr:uncharacterized protein J7T54_007189 [Emericellopsis cladophorae]KAI6778143.1 hypothetical protein J7T54_007189 [Emericellopsis cladophorae]